MSTVIVRPDGLIPKDANEKRVVQFDWDTDGNLATGVSITASTFTITTIRPAADTALTCDSKSVLTGSRKTQARVLGGTLGALYQLTNHITTDETPAQEKEQSVYIQIGDQ